jgi:hypothetical protein
MHCEQGPGEGLAGLRELRRRQTNVNELTFVDDVLNSPRYEVRALRLVGRR